MPICADRVLMVNTGVGGGSIDYSLGRLQQSSHGDYDNQYKQCLEYFNRANAQESTHSVTQPIPVVQRTRL